MPKARRRARAKAGAFALDRIVAVLTGLGHLGLLILALAFAGVLGWASVGKPRRDLLALAPGGALAAVFLLVGGFLFLASVRLWQGRRFGHVVTALVAGLGAAFGGYGAAQSGRADAAFWWSLFVLLFCLARLGGWGPKPT